MAPLERTHHDVGLAWLDAQGRVLRLNASLRAWLGPQGLDADVLPLLHPDTWGGWVQGEHGPARTSVLRRAQGEPLPVSVQADAGPQGEGWVLSVWPRVDVSERAAIDGIQRAVLEAVATARPLPEVMDRLCREVEAVAPGVACTVLAVDEQGRVHPLAAPSLPSAYSAALDGAPIGPQAGSCGTAAWRKEPVEVRSIATDPLWAAYKELALGYGLASCWSTPVMLDAERVGATFALYYWQEAAIDPYHRLLVQACTQLCRVALLHHEHETRIERLAYFDPTTGLPNRGQFTRRAEAHLKRLQAAGSSAAVLLMDLDRFKAINELQGHAAGNEVLRAVARRLAHSLPGLDTLARLGDDEFVVLLPEADREAATHTADALCAAMDAAWPTVRGHEVRLGMSIGFSLFPDDGHTLESLLKHADLALVQAKAAGRQCARGFTPAMARALEEKSWMEAELRKALAEGGLQLHFQPKVHLRSGALLGAEVLLRWPCPGRGWIPPDRFIPLAEECGLVNAIDAWVLRAACAQWAAWRDQGLAVPGLAVNVSPSRFVHDDVVADVQAALTQHALPPEGLTLEVTERLMLDEAQDRRAVSQLSALRAMGVGVSIDDFGTGYSSLSYLRRLPVSELKLDRSFVSRLDSGNDDRSLTRAIVSIAEAMELNLVAEGLETVAQAERLRQLGCEVAQGYWLSRPLSAEAFAVWCEAVRDGRWNLPG
jgi:diguanylate cyclase (GGDEF)-like protein